MIHHSIDKLQRAVQIQTESTRDSPLLHWDLRHGGTCRNGSNDIFCEIISQDTHYRDAKTNHLHMHSGSFSDFIKDIVSTADQLNSFYIFLGSYMTRSITNYIFS